MRSPGIGGKHRCWLPLLKSWQHPPFPSVLMHLPPFLAHVSFLSPRRPKAVFTPSGWGWPSFCRYLHLYHMHHWVTFCDTLRQKVIYFLRHFKATAAVGTLNASRPAEYEQLLESSWKFINFHSDISMALGWDADSSYSTLSQYWSMKTSCLSTPSVKINSLVKNSAIE